MPHQLVVREDRVTTKLRTVYDASSELHGKSLNESLENIPSVRIQAMLHLCLLQMKKVKIKFWEYHGMPNMMSLLLAFEFKIH